MLGRSPFLLHDAAILRLVSAERSCLVQAILPCLHLTALLDNSTLSLYPGTCHCHRLSLRISNIKEIVFAMLRTFGSLSFVIVPTHGTLRAVPQSKCVHVDIGGAHSHCWGNFEGLLFLLWALMVFYVV